MLPETTKSPAKRLEFIPGRLISLWDMIRFFLVDICVRWAEIQAAAKDYEKAAYGPKGNQNLIPEDFQHLAKIQGHFSLIAKTLDLNDTANQLYQFEHSLKHDAATPLSTHILLKNLIITTRNDMALKRVTFIPNEKVDYFQQEALFGAEVNEAFPTAIEDIKSAGNCYAAGLNTAAVFHFVRSAEVALVALAKKKLKIKNVGKSPVEEAMWQRIIEALEGKIEEAEKLAKGPKKRAALKLYHDLSNDCKAIKDKYRNPVCHGTEICTPLTAMDAHNSVKRFMVGVAAVLKRHK
jgi:hypothetical protein